MGRPEEYDVTQRSDVRAAFGRFFVEAKLAQDHLKEVDPNNPLLNLVTLVDSDHPSNRGAKFHDSFGPIVREHSDYPQGATLYYGLGVYVDLLESEIRIPKFRRAS